MVVFTCEACNESLKKNKVEAHLYKCRRARHVTCIDCQVDFDRESYKAHTSCISETEKYSGPDYVAKASANKGARKQDDWFQRVQSAIDSCGGGGGDVLSRVLHKIRESANVPRKEARFVNFCRNSMKWASPAVIQRAWSLIAAGSAEKQPTPPPPPPPPAPLADDVEPKVEAKKAKKRKTPQDEQVDEAEAEAEAPIEDKEEKSRRKDKKKRKKEKRQDTQEATEAGDAAEVESAVAREDACANGGDDVADDGEKQEKKRKKRKKEKRQGSFEAADAEAADDAVNGATEAADSVAVDSVADDDEGERQRKKKKRKEKKQRQQELEQCAMDADGREISVS